MLCKKCPFCGGEPCVEENGLGGWWIYCNNCNASTDVYEGEDYDDAAFAWDMRFKNG